MPGNSLGTFFSFLELQERSKITVEQTAGLLALIALLNIVDYLRRVAGEAVGVPSVELPATKAAEPALQKALTQVLGSAAVGEAGPALAGLAKSLGKNPGAVMQLVNLLGGEKGESKAQGK